MLLLLKTGMLNLKDIRQLTGKKGETEYARKHKKQKKRNKVNKAKNM